MPNFRAIKISRGTTQLGYAGTITNLQIVLNTQINPYLNQVTQTIIQYYTCQNFPTHLKSGVTPPPGGRPPSFFVRLNCAKHITYGFDFTKNGKGSINISTF